MRNVSLTLTVLLGVTVLALATLTITNKSQEITPSSPFHGAADLIVPQSRAYSLSGQQRQVQITGVTAEVRILQQVATTTMDVGLDNPTRQIQEAEMLISVPDGAGGRSFTSAGSAKEATAKLLPKE